MKKFRKVSGVLLLSSAILLSGCTSKEIIFDKSLYEDIEIEDKSEIMQIKYPKYMFAGRSIDEIKTVALNEGIEFVDVSNDDFYLFRLSREIQEKQYEQTRFNLVAFIEELKINHSAIKEIQNDNKFDSYTILVDSNDGSLDTLKSVIATLQLLSIGVRSSDGAEPGEVSIAYVIKDYESGKVMKEYQFNGKDSPFDQIAVETAKFILTTIERGDALLNRLNQLVFLLQHRKE